MRHPITLIQISGCLVWDCPLRA